MFDALVARAQKLHIAFDEPPRFAIEYGNSSASTTNIHFIKQLETMYSGDTILWFGFGAGATFVSAELLVR